MAVKPLVGNARWAVSAAGVPGSNNVAPNSGQRDTGWNLNQIGVSSFFNVLAFEAFRWFQYLDEGQLSGDHSIDGNLDVNDDLTVLGSLVAGPATLGNVAAVDVTASGDFIASGSSRYRHGTRTLVIAPGEAYGTGLTPTGTGGITLDATGDEAFINIPLFVGKRITAVRVRVIDNATGTTRLTVALVSKVDASITTETSMQSAGNGTLQTISMSPNEVMASGTAYMLRMSINASNSVVVHRVEVDYDDL